MDEWSLGLKSDPTAAWDPTRLHAATRKLGAETTYVDTDEARRLISQTVELGATVGVLPEYARTAIPQRPGRTSFWLQTRNS